MRSVLVATRGAPAVRAATSCAALGLTPVAVVARSDPQRRHAAAAAECVVLDDAHCGDGYNCVDCIAGAALRSGVDTVYPGWGPLAENPVLDRRLAALGIAWVGPPGDALRMTGDKGLAVAAAERIGVPVLPHAAGRRGIRALAAEHGFPLVLKPADGYQGNGVLVVRGPGQLSAALAPAGPGHDRWYAERYVEPARVVGMTVAVDEAGTAVSLGERESLLLSGGRKLLEAAPVLEVAAPLVEAMRRDARRLAVELGLRNVVTVEFLVHAGGYTFLEINGRLTGAYRMCEAQTGIDLIALQLDLTRGRRLNPAEVTPNAAPHVVQAHLFLCRGTGTGPRRLTGLRLPSQRPGVLVDCTLDPTRPLVFDTLAGQVLATGASRVLAAGTVVRTVEGIELTGVEHHGPDIVDWWARRFLTTAGIPVPDEVLGAR